jgi:hypothetical protein
MGNSVPDFDPEGLFFWIECILDKLITQNIFLQ